MNKREALFVKPEDLIDSNLSISATGLYVSLAAYVQFYNTGGFLEYDGEPLRVQSLALKLKRPENEIKDSFYELIERGFVITNSNGYYELPTIRKRVMISQKRSCVGSIGGLESSKRRAVKENIDT